MSEHVDTNRPAELAKSMEERLGGRTLKGGGITEGSRRIRLSGLAPCLGSTHLIRSSSSPDWRHSTVHGITITASAAEPWTLAAATGDDGQGVFAGAVEELASGRRSLVDAPAPIEVAGCNRRPKREKG